jgi:hypothetical protein
VISSFAPKLVLVALLILTLSFKVLAYKSQSASEQQDDMVRTHIAAFLARHGFEPSGDIAIQYLVGASAHSDKCQLLVADAAFQGWYRDPLRRFASADDQFFFYFRGHKYPDQPIWRTRLSGYWTSFLRNLGLNAPVEPVLGIVASNACELDAMPWQELAADVATVR